MKYLFFSAVLGAGAIIACGKVVEHIPSLDNSSSNRTCKVQYCRQATWDCEWRIFGGNTFLGSIQSSLPDKVVVRVYCD